MDTTSPHPSSEAPRFYRMEPEVAGGFGEGTDLDHSVSPPAVRRLEYEFEGWLGDPIVESHPVYLVTREVADQLARLGATGIDLRDVTVTKSELFEEMHPGRELPEFRWLHVTGTEQADDFGLDGSGLLVVSARIHELLRDHGLRYAQVQPWPRTPTTVDADHLADLKQRLRDRRSN